MRTDSREGEARKERLRVPLLGRIGAPLAAVLCYVLLDALAADLSPDGRAVASIAVWMAIWWMTEAVALPVTALLPLVLFPLAGVFSIEQAASPYSSKYIFLFMGGFMIALAIERWNLHRRIALVTVLGVGTRPSRIIGGFMLATAFLSMWISNTATTLLMLPIGTSVIAVLEERYHDSPDLGRAAHRRFSTCLMLSIAYAASIGGVATLVGTPPNVLLAGFLARRGISIGFAQWMLLGVPLAATFLLVAWIVLTRLVFRVGDVDVAGARARIRDELRSMGPLSRGERVVLTVFVATALLWVLRSPLQSWDRLMDAAPFLLAVDDTIIALSAAILLFVLPVSRHPTRFALDWDTAVRLPWGILLLFGGGLSLAAAVTSSGVDRWIGGLLGSLVHIPTIGLVFVVTLVVIFLTELTSNLATASAFLPVLAGVSLGLDSDPMLLFIPAALAASCAFMLPVATPPNAIVFGSGQVTINWMVRAGLWLNLIAALLVPLAVYLLGAWALGIVW